MSWYVYLLLCADNTFYTGITTEPERRLHEHNHNDQRAARYTRSRRPLRMVYYELCADRSEAAAREYYIRKLKPADKQALADAMLDGSEGELPR